MNDPSPISHRFAAADSIRDTSDQDRSLDPAPRLRRRRWLLSLGAAVGLLGALIWAPSVGRIFSSQQTVSRAQLRIAAVTRGTLVRDVSAQGRIVAATSPTLYSPIDGTIRLLVHAGETVERGQGLAIVDSPELRNELEGERSSLETALIALDRQRLDARRSGLRFQQGIDLARLDLQAAQRELRRAEDSLEHQVISRHDYEEAVDAEEAAQVSHHQAVEQAALETEALQFELATRELALERQRMRVAELERQVAELEITSPVDGIVGNLAVEERQAVLRSTPVATVVDLTQLEVELSVPESYGDDLAPGATVEISWNGEAYRGELLSVSPEVEEAQILARARFAGDPPPGIKRNQRVSTRILLEEIEDAVMVPRGPFLDSGASRIAYVVEGDLALRREIKVGAGSVSQIQILDGLVAGEEVILSSYERFEQADTVYLAR
ncbi:MAG: efflux RND transporter periplasmic adaptor subunit [Thermoanaerobaculia bacterium]|nr:efflux RND transporter periplasmic adaptor subunit [Thermoanaerobaculia bacterium]